MMVPLHVPASPELVLIGLIFAILTAIVVGFADVIRWIVMTVSGKERHTAELERRVVDLEAKFESDDASG